MRNRPARAAGTWDRLVKEIAAWPGTALVTHEFFGAASAEQASRALAALAPARVELVVTARDPLTVLTAAWQESLKYGERGPLEEFSREVSQSPLDVWNWRSTDAGEVLDRWARHLPADRVHVVVVPRTVSAVPSLWQRFAGLLVEDPDSYEVASSGRNGSMGLVQAEVLRRVTPHLTEIDTGPAVRRWIRDYLGRRVLAGVDGERFRPSIARVEESRRRGEAMVERITAGGFHVVGALDDLRVDDKVLALRSPEDVTDAELTDEAARVVAEVLTDLRRSRTRVARLRQRLEKEPSPGRLAGALRRVLPR